jgi:hypothetical protein
VSKITVERIAPNEHCRIYHLRKTVFDAGADRCCRWERNQPSYMDAYTCPALFEIIAEKIEGISSLFSPRAYEIWVSKGQAFIWEEIEPTLLEILQAYSADGERI